MSLARDIVDRIFFPGRDPHAIPVLDGGFSPNQRLEQARTIAELQAPDSLALGPDGRIYVSSGNRILALRETGEVEAFAEAAGETGALAWTADGRLLAAIAGKGLNLFRRDGAVAGRLEQVGGTPLRCITAITVEPEGRVLFTEGSRHNTPDRWLDDLMQKPPASGRLMSAAGDLSEARVIRDGLSWPGGLALGADAAEVLVTEAWSHRLIAIRKSDGAERVLVKNFAGYPLRIKRSPTRGFWVAFLGLRTQLTEFVLREDAFRNRMMESVPRDLWIGPSLGGRSDQREPTQIGQIKKLGIQKPWAPPRSYGLVARLDDTGSVIESAHSRVSGKLHGVTDMVESSGRILFLSKGHGKLAALDLHDNPNGTDE